MPETKKRIFTSQILFLGVSKKKKALPNFVVTFILFIKKNCKVNNNVLRKRERQRTSVCVCYECV